MYDVDNIDPETSIRTDLWPTMSLLELINQQDLVLTRLTTLQNVPGAHLNPTVRDIGLALQRGYDDLTKLIEQKTIQQQQGM